MKKLLLATTALVATAGVAAAQDTDLGVAITGFAELGVFDPGDDASLQFHTDIDATFTMTGETDGGLSFGADIDLDETDTDRTLPIAVNRAGGVTGNVDDLVVDTDGDGMISADEFDAFRELDTITANNVEVGGSPAFDNSTQGGESIFISGAFGTLTMGDTDGAVDWALQEASIGSSLNDDEEHAGWNGNSGLDGTYDGQIARYEYAFGPVAAAVSAEIDDDDGGDPAVGIGVRYSTSFQGVGVGFGLGYQRIEAIDFDFDEDEATDDEGTADVIGVSADVDFGQGFRGILNYSEADNLGYDRHVGAAVGYTVDALTVAANWGRFDGVEGSDAEDVGEGYALIVNYDLGGGAEAQFGVAQNDPEDGDDFVDYSLGIAMSF